MVISVIPKHDYPHMAKAQFELYGMIKNIDVDDDLPDKLGKQFLCGNLNSGIRIESIVLSLEG
jgi:hypothetical protein